MKLYLAIGVMTKFRLGERFYTVQTVASLLSRVKLQYQDRVSMTLINVNRDSFKHQDLNYLNGLIDTVKIDFDFNETFRDRPDHINEKTINYLKVKEAHDYAKILDYFYTNKTECKYTLLLEDDSIAASDWFDKIDEVLVLVGKEAKWLCIKLFTSYRYFDFLTHIPTVIKIVLQTILLTLMQIFVFVKKLKTFKFKYLKTLEMYILFLNTFLIILWLKFTHISPLGYGIMEYTIGFNAVANVYPHDILGLLSDYLRNYLKKFTNANFSSFVPKDIYLKEFKQAYRLNEFIVEPCLFQHVGVQSSLNDDFLDTFKLSNRQFTPFHSFSFNKEYLRPIIFDLKYWLS